MKLSKYQADVVELMKQGWELRHACGMGRARALLHRGNGSMKVPSSTVTALLRRGVIIEAKRAFPTVTYKLVEG